MSRLEVSILASRPKRPQCANARRDREGAPASLIGLGSVVSNARLLRRGVGLLPRVRPAAAQRPTRRTQPDENDEDIRAQTMHACRELDAMLLPRRHHRFEDRVRADAARRRLKTRRGWRDQTHRRRVQSDSAVARLRNPGSLDDSGARQMPDHPVNRHVLTRLRHRVGFGQTSRDRRWCCPVARVAPWAFPSSALLPAVIRSRIGVKPATARRASIVDRRRRDGPSSRAAVPRRSSLTFFSFCFGQDHDVNARAARGQHLLLDPADGQHRARQRDLARHRDVPADRPAGQRRGQRHDHRDAG